jgi:hypothetical protein
MKGRKDNERLTGCEVNNKRQVLHTIEINIEYDLSHISETLEENKTEEGNLVRQGFLIGFFVPISDRALLSGIIMG